MRIVILAEHGDGALREEPFRAAVAAAREIAAFAADSVSIEGLVLASTAGESIAAEAAKVAGFRKSRWSRAIRCAPGRTKTRRWRWRQPPPMRIMSSPFRALTRGR